MKINNSDFVTKELTAAANGAKQEIYRFIVSDERINRNGWKTITAGIDLADYLINPVVLLNHDREIPIGKAVNVFKDGDKLLADIWFHEQDEDSSLTKKLIDLGVLKMTSIDIRPVKEGTPIPILPEEKDKYPMWMDVIDVYLQSSLTEISIVTIPANTGAEFVEKLAKANDMFTPKEAARIRTMFTNPNNKINNNFSSQSKELDMEITEALKENGVLQGKITILTEEKSTASGKIAELNGTVEKLTKDLTAAQTSVTEANAKLQTVTTELETLKADSAKQAKELVEAQVDAKLAECAKFILPVENNAENNFKLKRDLVHLAMNASTLTDADGKSLYEIEIAKIKNRTSTDVLKNAIQTTESTSAKAAFSKDTFNYNNPEHAAQLAEMAREAAGKNGTSVSEETKKLLNEYAGADND